MNLGLVFLTGLTTGGLSCLAVQGGLLASSIAQQVEQNIPARSALKSASGRVNKKRQNAPHPTGQQMGVAKQDLARPIALFLGAKLIAYTLLGLLLGGLGSVLQLTPFMQAIMQLTIGVFMVGMALRMFNVHPFFRHFIIEPPAFITRYIRRTAKQGADNAVTPLFLGALTVLIPCGITQVMMAAAIATGNPLQGAAIMLAFTLGTSPVFFTLAYLATQVGKQWEARFTQLIAATVLILGLVAVNTGLNLMGTPLFPPHLLSVRTAAAADAQQAVQGDVITINVLDYGYTPEQVKAPAGRPLHLKLVTNNTSGCTRELVIPDLGIQQVLPENGETIFDLPAQAAGTSLYYTCSMGMYTGVIQF